MSGLLHFPFTSPLLPASPLSLLPPTLFPSGMYSSILMWPMRELVKLSQLCVSRCQNLTPPTTDSPLPLVLAFSLDVVKLTEPCFSSSTLPIPPSAFIVSSEVQPVWYSKGLGIHQTKCAPFNS